MSFNIRTRLITAILTIFIPVLILFVVDTTQLMVIHKSIQRSEGIASQISCLSDLSLSIDGMLMPANDYLITGEISEKASFYRHLAEVENHFPNLAELKICQWDAMDETLVPEIKENWLEEMKFLKRVRDGIEQIKRNAENIFLLKEPVANPLGVKLMIEMDAIAHDVINKDIEEHKKADARKLVSAIMDSEKAQKRYFIIRNVGYSIIIVFAVIFAVFYSKIFVDPIKKLYHGVDTLAEGDLKSRINIKTGDELELIAKRINEIADKLDYHDDTIENQVEKDDRA